MYLLEEASTRVEMSTATNMTGTYFLFIKLPLGPEALQRGVVFVLNAETIDACQNIMKCC